MNLQGLYKISFRLQRCIYEKIFNESWYKKFESAQYNAALAITGAIRGSNTEKLYQELGLESLQNRRKLRRLNLFYKIYKDQSPLYFHYLIPTKTPGNYPLRNVKEIPIIKVKQIVLEDSFFSVTITEWSDLDYSLRNASSSITVFKQNILKFIHLSSSNVFNIYNSHGRKLLKKLRLDLRIH